MVTQWRTSGSSALRTLKRSSCDRVASPVFNSLIRETRKSQWRKRLLKVFPICWDPWLVPFRNEQQRKKSSQYQTSSVNRLPHRKRSNLSLLNAYKLRKVLRMKLRLVSRVSLKSLRSKRESPGQSRKKRKPKFSKMIFKLTLRWKRLIKRTRRRSKACPGKN